jgi:calcineurin-like phosphoesterase family protein
MNHVIIESYNKVVNDNDDFYFLGDFSLGHPKIMTYALNEMKGNKFFIRGNHDKKEHIKAYMKYGTYLGYGDEIVVNGQKIVMCHYAHRVWHHNNRGVWHLYGHSHYNLEKEPYGKSMDVGIMTSYHLNGNWEPLNFNQIKTIMDQRTIKCVDHHIEGE